MISSQQLEDEYHIIPLKELLATFWKLLLGSNAQAALINAQCPCTLKESLNITRAITFAPIHMANLEVTLYSFPLLIVHLLA